MLTMIAVSRDDGNLALIGQALSSMADADVQLMRKSVRELNMTELSDNAPDVLLIDMPALDSMELDALGNLMSVLPPRVRVFVTASRAEIDDVRHLMRLEVSDFIPQPISRSELMSSLEAAMRPSQHGRAARRPTGSIYTVLGSGGGAGATTLAIEIAGELMVGKGKEKKHVCLIDFDMQFGNAAFSLDLADSRGLLELLESPSRIDAHFLRSVMAQHKSGLDVLAAPSNPLPLDAMSSETAERILSVARSEYDYAVVDMPRAWSDWSFGTIGASDLIFLVTNDCVSSLERARRSIRILTEHGLGAVPLMVVVNAMAAGWGAKRKLKEAEGIIGRPIDFCVRSDATTVRSALARGVFVREVKKKGRIGKDVRKVISYAAKKLQGELVPADAVDPAIATA